MLKACFSIKKQADVQINFIIAFIMVKEVLQKCHKCQSYKWKCFFY